MRDRQKIFNHISKFFELIGKPFYLVLLFVFIFLSLLAALITRFFNQLNQSFSYPRIQKPPSPHLPSFLSLHIKTVLKVVALFTITGVGVATYLIVLKDLPHPQKLVNRHQPITTNIYDRHHRPLYQLYQDENRSLVSLDDIPQHMILATIAIEDSTFYHHPWIFSSWHRPGFKTKSNRPTAARWFHHHPAIG
jgi:membrane peptidoglycan carboxypeptidase